MAIFPTPVKLISIIQNLGANLLIIILGLAGSIILARCLGPTQRGIFAAIILLPTIIQFSVNFGLSSATIYFTAQPLSNKNAIWSCLIILGAIQSIIGLLIGYFVIRLYLHKYGLGIINLGNLYLLTIPFGLFGMYATYILQGASNFKIINSLKCIVPIGYCAGIVWFRFHNNLSIENLVYLQLTIQFSFFIVAIFCLNKILLNPFLFKIDTELIRQMLRYGVKVWFGDISQIVNSRIDQFLIGGILSSRDLGIYTIATSVSGFTGVFAEAVRTIMLPSVTNKELLKEKINETLNFFKKYWIISIFFHLIFALSLPIIIPLVFGNAYDESIIICQILTIGSFFLNAKSVLGGGILGMGFPEIISKVEIIGMIISLIFSVILIKVYGLIGIPISISFSYFCQFLGLILLTNNKAIKFQKILCISPSEYKEYLNWLKNTTKYFK